MPHIAAKDDRPTTVKYAQNFTVGFSYDVYFTRQLFAADNPVFVDTLSSREPGRRHRFLVFIDSGVSIHWPHLADDIAAYARRHAGKLDLAAEPEVLPGGEGIKNDPEMVRLVHQRLIEYGIDRQSFVIAVGGGAVLDMVGYATATGHRGVRTVRVPTTVLSQCDSGVGVKNSVNSFGVKNFLGTFTTPFAVLNDIDFIATLETRDKIAGMAEAVKVALIRDRAFYEWIESHAGRLAEFDPESMGALIRDCADLHMRHISRGGDPFEDGSARPLDFGHWSAHRLETLSAHEVRHGEAVAIGIAADTRYSVQMGMLPANTDVRVCSLLENLGFRLWHPALETRGKDGEPAILTGLREFREHLGGELTVTILADVGRGIEVNEVDTAEWLQAMAWLKQRDAA